MSPRTGRPKAENPKYKSRTIRLDAETDAALSKHCDENKISISEAVRNALRKFLVLDK